MHTGQVEGIVGHSDDVSWPARDRLCYVTGAGCDGRGQSKSLLRVPAWAPVTDSLDSHADRAPRIDGGDWGV